MNRPARSPASHTLALVLAGATLASLACRSASPTSTVPPPPETRRAEITNEFTATAEVTAVEREARVVTLRREDGSLFSVQVGTAARNFDQIAVGDALRVRYREVLAASLRPAGEDARGVEGRLGAARTESGAKPGGGVGVGLSVRVKLESLDLARDIVVFSLASGELIAHRLATPEGREFAAGLKVGDVVQLDYAQVLALSVEEL